MKRWGPGGLWVLFTVVAVTSGLLALALVGQAVTSSSGPIMSAADVEAELASANGSTVPGTGQLTSPTSSPTSKASSHHSTEPSSNPADKQSSTTSATPSNTSSSTATSKPTSKPSSKPSSKPQKSDSTPSTTVRTISSRGGTVVAECSSGKVYLRSWSPASGYRVTEVNRGPASDVELRFDSSTTEVQVRVVCSRGIPVGSQQVSGGDGSDGESESSVTEGDG